VVYVPQKFYDQVPFRIAMRLNVDYTVETTALICSSSSGWHSLNVWFCGTCLLLLCFCVAFAIGRSAEAGAAWWFVDPKSAFAKVSFTCTWAVLLPLLLGWTALGMSWLSDTMHSNPECFSAEEEKEGYFTPLVFALLQVMCGMGALAYAVLVANVWDAERCLKRNEAAISAVEDEDLVERWGPMKRQASMEFSGGLLPEQFGDLPRHAVASNGNVCVICLGDMLQGECARSLPSCGHDFHRACIDMWLLRKTSCPLCNTDVRFATEVKTCDQGKKLPKTPVIA